ncbi:hypothetical protein [Nocardioides panzhihuensis]|uniref:Uncharacterized protein n=1 Tax=Nocardioides panzhihuensis TaxID=860243 RepID=A0A7Z0IUL1_9ACTN|nr:hypothetical protein [Nocardioides panzhihuensis]NYI79938.1 hypothetical protein [Nocardioides panzhihuensis]
MTADPATVGVAPDAKSSSDRTLSDRVFPGGSWSGLLPGTLVVGAMLVLAIRVAGVELGDALRFTAYVLVFLTFPGTVVWRAVAKPGPGLGNDLVLGTILGLVLEAPLYVLLRLLDLTPLIYAYPVAVLVGFIVVTRRRGARPVVIGRASLWSWAGAAVACVQALLAARGVWSVRPIEAVRAPYVDDPFHLAIAGDLLHHFPAQMPWVEGTPLFYHWLVYAHLASAATVTDIELVVLLRGLSIALLVLLTVGGAYAAAFRLTGRAWPGFVAALVLAMGAAPDFFGWTSLVGPAQLAFDSVTRAFYSPTHALVMPLQMVLMVLIVEMIRRERWQWRSWVLTVAVMAAVAGAKSSALPTIVAGLLLALVVSAVLRQTRAVRTLGALLGSAVVVFLVAQQVFYGGGTRATTIDLNGSTVQRLGLLMLPEGETLPGAAAVPIWICFTVGLVLAVVPVVIALVRGGWRRPELVFLVGPWAAGAGALMVLSHPALSQAYFLLGASGFIAVATAIALAELFPGDLSWREGVPYVGCAVLGGLALVAARLLVGDDMPADGSVFTSTLLTQLVIGLLLLGAAAAVALVYAKRAALPALPVVAALMTGVLLAGAPQTVALAVAGPSGDRAPVTDIIGPGGVAAARFVRGHSQPDELIATNAHCIGLPVPDCDRRNFWIAAYAERRVLVEGWAYIDPLVVGQPSTDLNNSAYLPFWDPELLGANDAAITDPSPATIATLRDDHGVDWIVVDRRYRADLPGLRRQLGQPRFKRGLYSVFDLDTSGGR